VPGDHPSLPLDAAAALYGWPRPYQRHARLVSDRITPNRLDPRRTMLAFDREVQVGHHVYPDVPIDDLIEALTA